MSTIRNAVARELTRRNRSGYEFAKSFKKVHPMTILKWLYSGHRLSLDCAERILDALDLVIVPKAGTRNIR